MRQPEKPSPDKGLLWGIFILFILPGLSLGLYGTIRSVLTLNWVEVEATIVEVNIEFSLTSRPRTGRNRPGKRKKRSRRKLNIDYIYSWKGKSINNDRIAFLQSNISHKVRTKTVQDNLKAGGKVIAYVNPNNPQKAVLVRGIHDTILIGYVSALSCFLFFAAIFGIFFEYPSWEFGWRSLGAMIVFYILYFGFGPDRSVVNMIELVV